jgi:hypothetical protein
VLKYTICGIMWRSNHLGKNTACHVGGRANKPLLPEQRSKHRSDNNNNNKNNNNNATSTVTDQYVDMSTENTASTSNTADNGTATTKQTQQIPGNTPQQNPSPTTPISTAPIHSESPTQITTYDVQCDYTSHTKHGSHFWSSRGLLDRAIPADQSR